MSKVRDKRLSKVGQRYGSLVINYICEDSYNEAGQYKVHCTCDCGNEIEVWAHHLYSGRVTSCGCRRESLLQINMKKSLWYDILDEIKELKSKAEYSRQLAKDAEDELLYLESQVEKDRGYYYDYSFWKRRQHSSNHYADNCEMQIAKLNKEAAAAKGDIDEAIGYYISDYPYADDFDDWDFD